MKQNSRIRFNPVTKEIEVEGTESFVKAYFNKLQGMLDGPVKEAKARLPKAVKAAPKKKFVKKAVPAKKASKATKLAAKKPKKAPAEKRMTNSDTVVGLIQASTEGISTAELKKETGLSERQIWAVVNRAFKEGKIRKVKRGVYSGAMVIAANEEPKIE